MKKVSRISDPLWNNIKEFYKLKTSDERLEFLIMSRNKHLENKKL